VSRTCEKGGLELSLLVVHRRKERLLSNFCGRLEPPAPDEHKRGFCFGGSYLGHHSSQVFFGTEKKSGVYHLPASGTPQFRARGLKVTLRFGARGVEMNLGLWKPQASEWRPI
jgi:hypothetical protein